MDLADLRAAMKVLATPERARVMQRYFKTGPGEYAEGDVFLGLSVPQVRRLVRASDDVSSGDLERLFSSAIHEERLFAALVLVRRFERAKTENERKAIRSFYLDQLDHIDNWDIVDVTTPRILGPSARESQALLNRLSRSKNIWHRRISVMAHQAGIAAGDADAFLAFAPRFLDDEHDLIHKAVGWMLREVGQRADRRALERFLSRYGARMPRTMLRYAIEKFPAAERAKYLA